MKCVYFLLFAALTFCFTSCISIEYGSGDQTQTQSTSGSVNTAEVIKSANFDFYNRLWLQHPEDWTGKIISFSGTVARPSRDNDPYTLEVSGSYNGNNIFVVLSLDHPVQQQRRIDEDIQIITIGKEIRVFALLETGKELQTESGYKRKVPTGKCLIIYNPADRGFKTPIWIKN